MAVEVGSAFISVRPDLRGFHNTIKRDLRAMTGSMVRIGQEWGAALQAGIKERLNPIEVRLDAGSTATRLAALNRALDKLDGRKVEIKIGVDLGTTVAQLIELQRMTEVLDNKIVKITIDVDVQGAVAELLALEQVLNRIDGRTIRINVDAGRGIASLLGLGNSASSASGGIGGLRRGILGLPLPLLAAGAVSAGAGLIQLAANLAPVIGLTAGLPLALTSIVAGLATLIVALKGTGAAFGAALGADAKKFEESLKGLSPAAQAAARELRALRPQFLAIRTAAQQAFFGPLRGQITAVTKALAGPLKNGIRAVSAEYGLAARSVLRFFASARTVDSVRVGFGSLAKAVRLMRAALVPVLKGFRDLSIAAVPSLLRVSAAVGSIGTRFGEWMSELAASGRVPEIIGAGLDVLKQVGSLLADLGGSIKSVFAAARDAGSGLFGVLGPVLNQLNAFLKTAQAQQAMTAFFQAIGAIGRALAPILPIIGGVVAELLKGLNPVVMALIPLVNVLVAALGRVVGALTPILVPLGQAIAQLAQGLLPILTPVIDAIALMAVQVGGALVAALTASLPALQQILLAMVGLLPALLPLLPLFTEMVTTIAPVIPPLVQLVAVLVGYLVPVLRFLITIVVKYWTIVMSLFIPVLRLMVTVVTWLAGIVQPAFHGIWVAVQAVGRAAMWLWNSAIMPAFRGIGALAMWLWNTAIGPALRGIAAVATWLWNSAIMPAIRGIGAVLTWLWTTVVMPVFTAIRTYITASWNFVRPIFTTIATIIRTVVGIAFIILSNIVKTAWIAIQIVIGVAWAIIKGIFTAIKWTITNVLAPVFKWLWNSVIKPAWSGIRTAISVAWNLIKGIFNAIKSFISNVLGPIFRWLWNSVIKPVWNGIKSTISSVYNSGIKPVFDRLKSAVGTVRDAFRKAVDSIKSIWDKLKNIAKTPVNFIIGIYNKGIVGLVNKLADFAGVKTRLTEIPKLARGGTLSDPLSMAPMITNRPLAIVGEGRSQFPEYVIPTDPRFRGRAQNLWAAAGQDLGASPDRKWLSGKNRLGGEGIAFERGGTLQALSIGGVIGDFVKSVKDFTIGNVEKGARRLLDKVLGGTVPGSGVFRNVVAAIPGWIKDKVLGWIKAKVSLGGGPGMQRGLAWAKTQSGKGYQWGGNGNPSWDCSGFTSAIESVIRGQKPHRRWSTHPFHGGARNPMPGWYRGQRSGYMIGVTGAGVGHVAGTLLGKNVESSGSGGVRVGGGARGFNNSMFPYQYGLKFDQGGWLPPGVSTVVNGTGRPEPVLTTAQLAALVNGPGGSDGPSTVNNIYPRTLDMTVRDLEVLQRKQDARARVGRPH